MKILKHGAMSGGVRVDLIGECKCGCKFSTFVDVFKDYPDEGGYAFRTDPECTKMNIDPEWTYCDPCPEFDWDSHRYLIWKPRLLAGVSYSAPCPECRTKVDLKEKVK